MKTDKEYQADDIRLAATIIDDAREGKVPHMATIRFTEALRRIADDLESEPEALQTLGGTRESSLTEAGRKHFLGEQHEQSQGTTDAG